MPVMLRAQTSHPLDPLSAAEISVAVATVRAAGATPEVVKYNTTLFSYLHFSFTRLLLAGALVNVFTLNIVLIKIFLCRSEIA